MVYSIMDTKLGVIVEGGITDKAYASAIMASWAAWDLAHGRNANYKLVAKCQRPKWTSRDGALCF